MRQGASGSGNPHIRQKYRSGSRVPLQQLLTNIVPERTLVLCVGFSGLRRSGNREGRQKTRWGTQTMIWCCWSRVATSWLSRVWWNGMVARLMGLAVRIVGSRAVAEEIVQEVFTRAWVAAPGWRAEGQAGRAFSAWLSRVATNLAIDQVRKPKNLPIEDAPELVDPGNNAEDALIIRDKLTRLQAALARFPPRQRAALL